jgi:hypothetical protein
VLVDIAWDELLLLLLLVVVFGVDAFVADDSSLFHDWEVVVGLVGHLEEFDAVEIEHVEDDVVVVVVVVVVACEHDAVQDEDVIVVVAGDDEFEAECLIR